MTASTPQPCPSCGYADHPGGCEARWLRFADSPTPGTETLPWCNFPGCPEPDEHRIETGRCLVVRAAPSPVDTTEPPVEAHCLNCSTQPDPEAHRVHAPADCPWRPPAETQQDDDWLADLLAAHAFSHVNMAGWTVCLCGHVEEGDDDDGSHARHQGRVARAALAARPSADTEKLRPTGAELIAAERRRQMEAEGWTPEHDAEHGAMRLFAAGMAYRSGDPRRWPWDLTWWKPKSELRNLIRAGALFQAAADLDGYEFTTFRAVEERDRCAQLIDELIADVRALDAR